MENFLSISKKICELEAQTFLTEEGRQELTKCYEILQGMIDLSQWDSKQWRVLMAMTCTSAEWFHDTDYANLTYEQQKNILSENPSDWYYQFLNSHPAA